MVWQLVARQLGRPGAAQRVWGPAAAAFGRCDPSRARAQRVDRRFASHHHDHGHGHHEEPPHYAYRGDGLPDVKCEELQQMLHVNERLAARRAQRGEREPHPSESRLEADDRVDRRTREVYGELQSLYNRVLTSNWHDTVQLTMNMDIWTGNLERLRKRARDLPHVKVQALLAETLRLFDVLLQVEDLQDHLYELMEELSLDSPEAAPPSELGVGANFGQHVQEVLRRYHELKRAHPEYTQKLRDSLGYTLALLRQRYTFSWPEEHEYFY